MIACDCHVHVFGSRDTYPQRPDRAYTPGIASLDTLRRNGAALGITRFVIVQASVHGADNSCLLDSLDALDGDGRGVVVVDPKTVAPSTLDDWSRRGARGLRINLYSDYKAGGSVTDALRNQLRDRFQGLVDIAPDGWHVEVIAPMPFPKQCAYAAKLGYDGLEVAPYTFSEEPHRLGSAQLAAARAAAKDAGVAVTGLHWLLL